MARALHRLPRRLVLIGIEAGGLDHGEPLSAQVSAALEPAVDAVIGVLPDARAVPNSHRGWAGRTAPAVQEVDR